MKAKLESHQALLDLYAKIPAPGVRWEQGIEHHPESKRLLEHLMMLDFEVLNDHFCWKKGGDGDNGEALMYLLDMIFEQRDMRNKA